MTGELVPQTFVGKAKQQATDATRKDRQNVAICGEEVGKWEGERKPADPLV